jgi:phosphatidylglycerophosphate synthase
MSAQQRYTYAQSIKSDLSDEIINTYLLRPVAGVIVRFLYRTPVTPNGVTVAAIGSGMLAALFYSSGSPSSNIAAGLLVTLKDLLDSADGQLARAKNLYSRAGRFLDSIGDFLVNLLVFASITGVLFVRTGNAWVLLAGTLAFLGISLRVSYHVYYHTSYLHLHNDYAVNRLTEEMRPEDYQVDRLTFRLHTLFIRLYGWQDRLMERIDGWCKGGVVSAADLHQWYGDLPGLRISGLLGLGTELMLLTLCSILDELGLYLALNLLLMNCIWGVSILYRRYLLAPRVRRGRE